VREMKRERHNLSTICKDYISWGSGAKGNDTMALNKLGEVGQDIFKIDILRSNGPGGGDGLFIGVVGVVHGDSFVYIIENSWKEVKCCLNIFNFIFHAPPSFLSY